MMSRDDWNDDASLPNDDLERELDQLMRELNDNEAEGSEEQGDQLLSSTSAEPTRQELRAEIDTLRSEIQQSNLRLGRLLRASQAEVMHQLLRCEQNIQEEMTLVEKRIRVDISALREEVLTSTPAAWVGEPPITTESTETDPQPPNEPN